MAEREFVRRIHGSEVEYGVTSYIGRDGQISFRHPKGFIHLPGHNSYSTSFLHTGDRSYLDVGSHPEFATASVGTLSELLIREIMGERVTDETYVDTRDPKKPDVDNRVIISLHKRSIDPQGTVSNGAHENYLTTLKLSTNDEDGRYLINALGTFSAVRSVFAGAGHPRGRTYKREEFAVAQKMQHIEQLAADASTQKKPLINLRGGSNHHTAGSARYRRFHNINGDALISPRGIFMKHGSMDVVLDILEQGIDVSDLLLQDPVKAAGFIAESPDNITKELPLENGKSASALELNRRFIDRARLLPRLGLMLPGEKSDVIDIWTQVIDDLAKHAQTGDHIKGLEWVDWYTKRDIFEGYNDKKGGLTEKQFENLILTYDQVRGGIGMHLRRPGGRFSLDMPSEAEIAYARQNPPPGRSAMTGAFIKRAAENDPPTAATIDWDSIKVDNNEPVPLRVDDDYSAEAIAEKLDKIFGSVQSKPVRQAA